MNNMTKLKSQWQPHMTTPYPAGWTTGTVLRESSLDAAKAFWEHFCCTQTKSWILFHWIMWSTSSSPQHGELELPVNGALSWLLLHFKNYKYNASSCNSLLTFAGKKKPHWYTIVVPGRRTRSTWRRLFHGVLMPFGRRHSMAFYGSQGRLWQPV